MAFTGPTMWECSKQVLGELEKLLTCGICDQLVSQPRVPGSCEHFFCSKCIESVVSGECPTCHIPSHARDIQTNRQVATAVQLCQQLELMLSKPIASVAAMTHHTEEETISTPKPPIQSTDCSVYDLVTSPTATEGVLPCTPVARCTRRTAAISRKRQAVEMSNLLWGIRGGASGGHSLSKCTSCKKGCHKGVSFVCGAPPPGDKELSAGGIGRADLTDAGESVTDTGLACRKTRQQSTQRVTLTTECHLPKSPAVPTGNTSKYRRICVDSGLLPDSQEQLGQSKQDIRDSVDENTSDLESTTSPKLSLNSPNTPRHDTSGLPQIEAQSLTKNRNGSVGSSKAHKSAPHKQSSTSFRSSLSPSPQTPSRAGQGWFSQLGQGGVTPLSVNSKTCGTICSRTVSSPASVTKRNVKGETLLHLAAIKGDMVAVERLLETGAAASAKDHAGWTPLHEACNHGHVDVATVLLEWGAAINIPGFGNNTPLHDAVDNARVECVRLLVSRGADVNARNSRGETPMDLAVTPAVRDALCHTSVLDIQPCSLSQLSQSEGRDQMTLLMTSMTRDQRALVESCAALLHARIVDSFSHEVTHLVTSVSTAGTCARTLKYLLTILTGKWVVSTQWIRACLETKGRVAEEPYEVPGSRTTPTSLTPRNARLNHDQQLPRLFDGCSFYLRGDFIPPTPARDEITLLVKTGGGTVLHREPKPETMALSEFVIPYHVRADQQLAHCCIYVLHDNANAQPKMCGARRCDVPVAWLLDCVAKFQFLDPAKYLKKPS